MPPSPDFRPTRRHAELGQGFFELVEPASFPLHGLRWRNRRSGCTPVRAALEGCEPRVAGLLAGPYFAGTLPCTMLIDEVEAL